MANESMARPDDISLRTVLSLSMAVGITDGAGRPACFPLFVLKLGR